MQLFCQLKIVLHCRRESTVLTSAVGTSGYAAPPTKAPSTYLLCRLVVLHIWNAWSCGCFRFGCDLAAIHCLWLCCSSSNKGTVHIFALQVGCSAYCVICKRLKLWWFSFWLWSSYNSLFVVVLLILRQRHCSPSTHQHSEQPQCHFYATYGCDQWSCLRRDTIQDITILKCTRTTAWTRGLH